MNKHHDSSQDTPTLPSRLISEISLNNHDISNIEASTSHSNASSSVDDANYTAASGADASNSALVHIVDASNYTEVS